MLYNNIFVEKQEKVLVNKIKNTIYINNWLHQLCIKNQIATKVHSTCTLLPYLFSYKTRFISRMTTNNQISPM